MNKSLISIADLKYNDLEKIFKQILLFKKNKASNRHKGKSVGLLFEKFSTRTRLSFEVAISRLGAYPIYINKSDTQLSRGESIKETAKMFSLYLDALVYRTSKQKHMEDFVNFSYKAGAEVIIRMMAGDGMKMLYDKDIIGKPTNSIMLMNGINGLSDFDLIINISEGYPGIQEWVQYTVDNNELPIIGIIPTNQSENVVSLLKGISRYGGNRKKLNSVIVGYLGARIYQKLVVNKIGEDLANIPVGINDYVYLKEFYSLDESGRITTYHQYFQYGALVIYTGIIGNKINYNKWSPSRVLLENKEYEINNYIWPDIPTKFIGK